MSLNGIKVAVLSGVEDISPAVQDNGRIVMNSMQLAAVNNVALNAAIFGVDLQRLGILAGEEYLEGIPKDAELEKGLYRYLVATRQATRLLFLLPVTITRKYSKCWIMPFSIGFPTKEMWLSDNLLPMKPC